MVGDLEHAVEADVARTRTAIGRLLGEKIRLLPTEEGRLEAELVGDYAGLVALSGGRRSEAPREGGRGACWA